MCRLCVLRRKQSSPVLNIATHIEVLTYAEYNESFKITLAAVGTNIFTRQPGSERITRHSKRGWLNTVCNVPIDAIIISSYFVIWLSSHGAIKNAESVSKKKQKPNQATASILKVYTKLCSGGGGDVCANGSLLGVGVGMSTYIIKPGITRSMSKANSNLLAPWAKNV